ncbi:hypothetical protein JOD24_002176 [Kroppenstedtia sanguinis]|uniref:Uncharacterized protein n=1 Tax=Kroppenstedtia sanguinis TaxID=1380684 RepID=A0ABW4C8I7_9BACL
MINQKIGGGRESCAAKATFAILLSGESGERAFRGNIPSLCCFRKALPLPDRKIWSGQFSLPCRMATVAW